MSAGAPKIDAKLRGAAVLRLYAQMLARSKRKLHYYAI